jgi:hypothetical protein
VNREIREDSCIEEDYCIEHEGVAEFRHEFAPTPHFGRLPNPKVSQNWRILRFLELLQFNRS